MVAVPRRDRGQRQGASMAPPWSPARVKLSRAHVTNIPMRRSCFIACACDCEVTA